MITVKILHKPQEFYQVEVSGHANQNEYGQDIVCSAVSALTIATLNGLIEVVKAEVEYEIDDGYTKFEVYPKDSIQNDFVKVLIGTYELGIQAMLEDYGQYVRIEKKEVQPHDQD